MIVKLQRIQVLRAVAAVAVLLQHASLSFSYYMSDNFPKVNWGNLGVDLFFVLSGFIICFRHFGDIKNRGSATAFLKKRFIRIYPVYIIVLSFTLLLYFILHNGRITNSTLEISLSSGSDWILLLQNFLLYPGDFYFVAPAWSLTFEVFFYLLFALCIRFGIVFARILLVTLIILIVIVNVNSIGFSFRPLRILSTDMVLEFIAGCIIGYLVRYRSNLISRSRILTAFVILVAASFYYFGVSGNVFDRSFTSKLFTVLYASMLVCTAAMYDVWSVKKMPSVLLLLGNASYSLYLMHSLILSTFNQASATLIRMHDVHLPLFVWYLSGLLITMIGSVVFFRLVEQPVLKYLNGRFVKKQAFV